VRVALDFGLTPPLPDRARRRRTTALERRLASLTLPGPPRDRRHGQLQAGDPTAPALALTQLVAPTRDTLGAEAGDAIALAARVARTSVP
jgi:hypothetical protein